MNRFLPLPLLAVLITAIMYDYPNWRMHQAYRLANSGNHPAALSAWSSIERLPGRKHAALFNRGVAAYRMAKYSAASSDFRSVSASSDMRLRSKALYNLGTTYIRIAAEQGDRSDTAAERYLTDAVKSLQESLALDPSEASTKVNLNVARTRLSAILKAKGQQDKGTAQGSQPQQRTVGDNVKRSDPKEPDKGRAKPGKATDMDQEGAKRRSAAMDRTEALRMLDEARGRESLRSTAPSANQGRGLTPPEKDW